MLDRDYKVKFITSKNNFVFLSDKDHRLLDQDLLIRLSYGLNKTAYFSLGPPLSSLKEAELAISSVLAKELGLFKNDTVSLSSTEYICSVNKLNILPSSGEDYEILELLADAIQDTLLNQVRIVHNKQKLVIWVSHSTHVTVEVDGVLPISPGKLEQLTEISIMQPNVQQIPALRETQTEKKRGSFTAKHSVLNQYNKSQTLCRIHPIEDLQEEIDASAEDYYFQQPFNVFISKSILPAHFEEDVNTVDDMHLVDLRVIPVPPEAKDALDESSSVPKHVVVRLFALEDLCVSVSRSYTPVVFANQCIFEYFGAKIGAKVILEPLKDLIKIVKSVHISTTHDLLSKADEVAKNYLLYHCQREAFLMNSNIVLTDSKGCKFRLGFDGGATFYLMDRSFVRTCKFSLDENELVADKTKDKKCDELKLCLDCCNYKTVLGDVQKFVGLGLQSTWHLSNVLIVGKPGTGKTSLLSHLSSIISKTPHHIHTETLKCKKLKGKNIDSLQKVLNIIFLKLIYYQPSLLLLDDLHVICEKVVEGEAPTQENLHLNKVSEMLADTLESYTKTNSISIVATGESVSKLNQHVFTSRGKHLFKNVLTINDLDKDDRIGFMKFFLEAKEVKYADADFEALGVKTEGYVVQDIIDYTDKVIFEAYKENVDCDNIKVSTTHCEEALKNTSSLSLREVQLHSPGERDFKDVGGLEDIKKILVESMMWPAQYPNIFGRAPLRLQSGLLLYGPPGTGKTILAGAAAKQCNMRLISIKGPELLSKYIGASEQAVRDVFQKAQNAKPCILFFDEFDSLAPRRGHDNTGVTDRVVNQFLTQLDGVESLSGVCVLAATSRPDLLDPALLRPGRLDRQILCPMPDRDSRFAILTALSKAMKLSKDANLSKLADDTVGYSGADLQAVLYTAQLSSVEYLLDSNQVKHQEKEDFITQSLLEDAVRTTRPSLTSDEKLKYERIYARFQGKGDLLNLKSGKQKTTLA